MSEMIEWIAAEAERPIGEASGLIRRRRHEADEENEARGRKARGERFAERVPEEPVRAKPAAQQLPAHQFPTHQFAAHQFPGNRFPVKEEASAAANDDQTAPLVAGEVGASGEGPPVAETIDDPLRDWRREEEWERERQRRVYRSRTVSMLRKYMRYSIETGRMPSLLGREFFRAKVTSYTVVTFEDRVIFVYDMEKCLGKLDQFARDLIARLYLQEHDRWATARLLSCNEKTIRRLAPSVLDQLSDILLEVGLLERIERAAENSCQGGTNGCFSASDSKDDDNKF